MITNQPYIKLESNWPFWSSLCCHTCLRNGLRGTRIRVLWMGIAEKNWIDDLHIDESSRFIYLTVPPLLRKLPWSEQDCCDRITVKGAGPQGSGKLFSRHGLLQLALWATPPFYKAPDKYIYDPQEPPRHPRQQRKRTQQPKLYRCPQQSQLFDALAEALLVYEARCGYLYQSPAHERRAWMFEGVERVSLVLDVLDRLREKGYSPERRELKAQREKIGKAKKYLEQVISNVTEEDFRRAGAPVPNVSNRWSTAIKTMLISAMHEAFKNYTPSDFIKAAIYRGIATILHEFGVRNNQGGHFNAEGIERILHRPVNPEVEFKIELATLFKMDRR
jgi:hypothetical protein